MKGLCLELVSLKVCVAASQGTLKCACSPGAVKMQESMTAADRCCFLRSASISLNNKEMDVYVSDCILLL